MRASTLLSILAIVAPSVVLAAASPDAELDYSLESRELERRKYSPTCNNCTLQTTSVLSCLCDQTANGVTTQVAASLDLNTCITNMDGILMWYPSGQGFYSCSKARIASYGPFYLRAYCTARNGTQVYNRFFNLDNHIYNVNGSLVYDGKK
ncbi:Cyanovirin-N [Pestalotiopsis sp. NC0098]|nr:Cyanovirin-N [Pestalotiopsis sp. NC0098]